MSTPRQVAELIASAETLRAEIDDVNGNPTNDALEDAYVHMGDVLDALEDAKREVTNP